MTSTVSVPLNRLRGLLLDPRANLSSEVVDAVEAALASDVSGNVLVGFPMAHELVQINRHRCASIEGFEVSRFGWEGFFEALEGRDGVVGLVSIVSNGWRLMAVFDDVVSRALACVCRPPN